MANLTKLFANQPLNRAAVITAVKTAQADGGGVTTSELQQLERLKKTDTGQAAFAKLADTAELDHTPKGVRVQIDLAQLEQRTPVVSRPVYYESYNP